MNVLDLAYKHELNPRKMGNKDGGEWHSACPGCGGVDRPGDPSDRFAMWPEARNNGKECGGKYWCRRCEKSGDAIQFLRDFEGLSFVDACRVLGRESGPGDFKSKSSNFKREWEPNKYESPEKNWTEKATKFVNWAYEQLMENQTQLDWLKARGLEATNGLGWNPGEKGGPLYRNREDWGLSEQINEKGGRSPLALPIGLVIPTYVDNELWRINIRRPDPLPLMPDGTPWPRYYYVPGSRNCTMVLNPERKGHVIVESELDAILISKTAGDLVSGVALRSVSGKPDQRTYKLLKDSLQILVAIDFDKAGAGAWPWWKEHFPECERWPVPEAKDPGDAFKAGVDVREWVRAGLPAVFEI
jgi:hypothetical protein